MKPAVERRVLAEAVALWPAVRRLGSQLNFPKLTQQL